ncbi:MULTISPECIES: DUF1707 SHOCT-like domain-containing protein [Brevibacterium]|uniref:DUF1707 domain-containing protein n=2 Tax=Brevibacterium TaxID=1696 RepID=A0A4Z0KIP4_BREAU|nr:MULTISPECIES: DUF1707 domain-containing protein [Brevibacterium]TGD38004.1 DUF1707 domain-containing protein [Brevibacterium aurantiacum]
MSAENDQSDDPSRTVLIGDNERDHAIETLRAAAGDGRITIVELEERMELVEAARFPIDLDRPLAGLGTELPSTQILTGATGTQRSAGSGYGWSPDNREVLRAPWNGLIRRGRWLVSPYLHCKPAGRLLELNFLDVITGLTSIDIRVSARTGTLKIVVPDSWGVDISELDRSRIAVITFKANAAPIDKHPVVRVRGNIGSGVLQALGPNRRERRLTP